MCGISGIIKKRQETVERGEIEKLNSCIEHRGPDSQGIYLYQNMAFGHRRLSIIDLTSDGLQPMKYDDNLVITFNGEIYNYLEIRDELKLLGYIFNTNSDTEVILAAYQEWGRECVTRFNGMWAFAILDKNKQEVFISRDRFGVKPVYYINTPEVFAFGSEIKQLLPLFDRLTVNHDVLVDYLAIGLEDHLEDTFFTGVKKVPSSFNFHISLANGEVEMKQYFDLVFDAKIATLSEEESINLYKASFIDSIKLRLRSDVKVGTCLSGGLDSSAIAYYASKFYYEKTGEKFLAFHVISSEDAKFNELRFVNELVKDLPIELITIHAGLNDVLSNMDKVIRLQEEPFGSPSVILQYFLMQKSKEYDCKVLLDGQGGDETLLGYERYYASIFVSSGLLSKFKLISKIVRRSKLSLPSLMAHILYFSNPILRMIVIKGRASYLKAGSFKYFSIKTIRALSKNYRNIFKLQKQEIFHTQLPHLLRYEDKNSMYFSIETRLPFLDFRSVTKALSINNFIKIKDGWSKFILRKATEKQLPDSIVWRKNKIGFEIPEDEIMNTVHSELVRLAADSDIVTKYFNRKKLMKQLPTMNVRMKWRIYNIVKWEKYFNVKVQDGR